MSAAALLLVVEDEPLILMELETALEDAGFQVLSAHDAKTAMRLYGERSADVRAVLTDIRLGNGPTGWDVARHAREAVPNTCWIATNGLATRAQSELARAG